MDEAFFQHFDRRDKEGLTEFEHELKYNSDNIIVPDSPVLPSHTTDKRSSNDIPRDEGWRSRISRSTHPGKILYTNPHQPSTWGKKPWLSPHF